MLSKDEIISWEKRIEIFLRELIFITKSIFNLIWINKGIVFFITLIYLLYIIINYIAFEMPKRTVVKYYSAVENKELDAAWKMISEQGHIRWKEGFIDFEKGYRTLANTKILNLQMVSDNSLIRELTTDKKQIIVDMIVIENFRKVDVIDPDSLTDRIEQRDNILSLRLRYADDTVEKLKSDSLSSFKNVLKLVRHYKKIFTIQKDKNSSFFNKLISNNWLITDIDNKEMGLIFDTTFY